MTIERANKRWVAVIAGLVGFYYIWLLAWDDQYLLRSAGGSLLSILGAVFACAWLWGAVEKSRLKNERTYWILLFSGTLSYLLAELCWFYADVLLPAEVPYPGLYDLFYIGSVLFYFIGFIHRIWKFGKKFMLIKFLFDVATVMTVSVSFSWYYLLAPLITIGEVSSLALTVTLFYPIGDILLLFCASVFYFAGSHFFKRQTIFSILLGLSVQIIADSIYFFEVAHKTYASGSWIDPLFILPIMLIGYTALSEKETISTETTESGMLAEVPLTTTRILIPYLLVICLFGFTAVHSNGMDSLSIGSGISIGFIILRQFIIISENRKLLTEYRVKAEALKISEERYKSLYQYNPDSIFSMDLKGKIENMNQAGAVLVGQDHNKLIGTQITDFVDKEHREKIAKELTMVKEGWINSQELQINHTDESKIWINITHIPILVKNKLVGIFGIGKNITENKLNEKRIQFYAYHDYLTGLANRMLFEEKLEQVISYADQTHKKPAILFLDLDKFKEINDEYGHEIGDHLLIGVSERIKQFANGIGLAARIGGDEFTILIEDISDQKIQEDIEVLHNLLNETYRINNMELTCKASIGIAHYPADGTTPNALIKKADNAMYQRKKIGRTSPK